MDDDRRLKVTWAFVKASHNKFRINIVPSEQHPDSFFFDRGYSLKRAAVADVFALPRRQLAHVNQTVIRVALPEKWREILNGCQSVEPERGKMK